MRQAVHLRLRSRILQVSRKQDEKGSGVVAKNHSVFCSFGRFGGSPNFYFTGILGMVKPLRVLKPVGPAALKVQFIFEPVMVCVVIVPHHNALAHVGPAVISDVAHVTFYKTGCSSLGRFQVLNELEVSF